MIDWTVELPKIKAASETSGVDFCFVQAIRAAEDGPAGAEFGILSVPAPTYDDQLRICINTVTHRLASYKINPLTRDAFGHIRYSDTWIAYFSEIYAPPSASPKNLNWYPNVCDLYAQFRDE